MSRRKDNALPVPATPSEALELIAEYVGDDRAALRVKLAYEAAIDKLKIERDTVLASISTVQDGRFAALKAWWEAGGRDLAKRGRSTELAGAKIGIQLSKPAVKFAKGVNAEAVARWLGSLRWAKAGTFRRIKIELDKQAVIKHFREADVANAFEGLLFVEQHDEFFIDTQLDEAAIAKEVAAS